MDTRIIVRKALENGLVVPAFNIPHPPMLKAIAQAIVDENSVAMIQVARLEWEKFESESLERIAEEYAKYEQQALDAGVEFIEVSAEERVKIADALQGVISALEDGVFEPGYLDAIRDM